MKNYKNIPQNSWGGQGGTNIVLISQREDQSFRKDGYSDPIAFEMTRINYQPFYGFSEMMTTAFPLNDIVPTASMTFNHNNQQSKDSDTMILNFKAWDKKLFNKIVRKPQPVTACLFSSDIERSMIHV
ncbi:MAG: hypothetical protein FWG98_11420 [Candidatus Cloacimonetes bacterium]|nr:hypothetical protein [Candidatus Cloacimonadota bacterium]